MDQSADWENKEPVSDCKKSMFQEEKKEKKSLFKNRSTNVLRTKGC